MLCSSKEVSMGRVPHFSPFLREVGKSLRADPRSILRVLLATHGAQIDPQLLRLLIQVTALQSKTFRRHAHVLVAALQFRKNHFTFKRLYAVRECTGTNRRAL